MLYRRQFVVTILMLSFAILFVKDLAIEFFDHGYDNCFEVGHIHKSAGPCHEAKSIFSYSLFPYEVSFNEPAEFSEIFDFVLVVKNNFKTPYLEPVRKPPRVAA